jgi:uncharacterized pyridoxamine 5'-phosphate oxidase family protein
MPRVEQPAVANAGSNVAVTAMLNFYTQNTRTGFNRMRNNHNLAMSAAVQPRQMLCKRAAD